MPSFVLLKQNTTYEQRQGNYSTGIDSIGYHSFPRSVMDSLQAFSVTGMADLSANAS